jgi:hypothetical protein
MRSLLGLVVVVLTGAGAAALGSACGGATVDAGAGPAPDAGVAPSVETDGVVGNLPCDVEAVVAANCRKCHASPPQHGSPMPLVTAADLHAPSKSNPARKVYELVTERIADDAKPMPPPPSDRLSAADRATLTAWAAAGAPASTAHCTTKPPPPDLRVTCKPDLPLAPATPWEMPMDSGDEYVCYGIELSRPAPTHVVGFVPRIDNATIVHHIVLFETDEAYPSTPTRCSAAGSLTWRMVTGWAPGNKGFELPPEAGFPIKPTGTHYVVQMH